MQPSPSHQHFARRSIRLFPPQAVAPRPISRWGNSGVAITTRFLVRCATLQFNEAQKHGAKAHQNRTSGGRKVKQGPCSVSTQLGLSFVLSCSTVHAHESSIGSLRRDSLGECLLQFIEIRKITYRDRGRLEIFGSDVDFAQSCRLTSSCRHWRQRMKAALL